MFPSCQQQVLATESLTRTSPSLTWINTWRPITLYSFLAFFVLSALLVLSSVFILPSLLLCAAKVLLDKCSTCLTFHLAAPNKCTIAIWLNPNLKQTKKERIEIALINNKIKKIFKDFHLIFYVRIFTFLVWWPIPQHITEHPSGPGEVLLHLRPATPNVPSFIFTSQ